MLDPERVTKLPGFGTMGLRVPKEMVATPPDSPMGPLMVQLHRYVASLVRCFTGDTRELEIPRAVSGLCEVNGSLTDPGAEPIAAEN